MKKGFFTLLMLIILLSGCRSSGFHTRISAEYSVPSEYGDGKLEIILIQK